MIRNESNGFFNHVHLESKLSSQNFKTCNNFQRKREKNDFGNACSKS